MKSPVITIPSVLLVKHKESSKLQYQTPSEFCSEHQNYTPVRMRLTWQSPLFKTMIDTETLELKIFEALKREYKVSEFQKVLENARLKSASKYLIKTYITVIETSQKANFLSHPQSV